MTSVKEFAIEREPTPESLGRGRFVFTDAYSVFDWGQMPDDIPKKGPALCTMGAANFEALESAGIETHYLGVGTDAMAIDDVEDPPREMAIQLTQTPDLTHTDHGYDYDTYHEQAGKNYLIPLEIVFRNRVPLGSSLRERTEPHDHNLEITDWPAESITLVEPIIEFSTKFEESDRYLSKEEADEIAGRASINRLRDIARDVNAELTKRAEEIGLTHLDGKIECYYYDGDIVVADVVGTFDENRFAYDGQQLSKEVIRQYYKRKQPDWVDAIATAKVTAADQGSRDWRSHCTVQPDPLPAPILERVSEMYAAGANAFLGRPLFTAPPLHTVAARIGKL